MSKLGSQLQQAVRATAPRTAPVWLGPCSADEGRGGVTQGLLGRYLACPERFRLLVMDGLKPMDRFNVRLEYGSMWHVCEEALAKDGGVTPGLFRDLREYVAVLCKRYPMEQNEIDKWWNVCRTQFPLYVDHWRQCPEVRRRTPLLQEQVFHVPYKLPSGRVVYLRGKWDSVDLLDDGVWLQENKTKSKIDEEQIRRQMAFDLQTMTYIVALQESDYKLASGSAMMNTLMAMTPKGPVVKGVRYNVIRRPLGGGAGSIVQHKATAGAKCSKCKGVGGACVKCGGAGRTGGKPSETKAAFFGRLTGIIKEAAPEYFMRWTVEVPADAVTRFRCECLDPVMENLVDDYEWWQRCFHDPKRKGMVWDYWDRAEEYPEHASRHYRVPYGIYNVTAEGGVADLDAYLDHGSTVGLERAIDLFPELREVA